MSAHVPFIECFTAICSVTFCYKGSCCSCPRSPLATHPPACFCGRHVALCRPCHSRCMSSRLSWPCCCAHRPSSGECVLDCPLPESVVPDCVHVFILVQDMARCSGMCLVGMQRARWSIGGGCVCVQGSTLACMQARSLDEIRVACCMARCGLSPSV